MSDFGCLEVKSAAGPSGKPASLGMYMCSSLLVFPLFTVLMLNGTIVLIHIFFSYFLGCFQTPCQQELDQVLERISTMRLPDERGPLEHLYSLHIPNCDKHGLYNLKQVSGESGSSGAVCASSRALGSLSVPTMCRHRTCIIQGWADTLCMMRGGVNSKCCTWHGQV